MREEESNISRTQNTLKDVVAKRQILLATGLFKQKKITFLADNYY